MPLVIIIGGFTFTIWQWLFWLMELRLTLPPRCKEGIMTIGNIVRGCPEYASENIVRNGHDYKGAPKYHFHECGAYGTLEKWAR